MAIFKKGVGVYKCYKPEEQPEELNLITDKEVIEYLRNVTSDKYSEIKQIVDIYRDADEQIAIVKAGSKRKYQEQLREQKKQQELDDSIDVIVDEMGNEIDLSDIEL